MAVVNSPDDRWRDIAVRLAAAAELVDRGLEGGQAPSAQLGGYVLETGRLLIERLDAVATRIGVAYRDELDETILDRLRDAVRQLRRPPLHWPGCAKRWTPITATGWADAFGCQGRSVISRPTAPGNDEK